MAYSRDYPNSIIPKGSKVVECLQNDDKELKRILGILSDIGVMSLFGSKRQCVLHAATGTDGKPSYLTANGLNVAINGSTTPVIVTFAGGYNANGTVDKTDTIVDTVNAWTMPANGTYYLYIDKDMSTGILSYGYTTIPDTYATTAPESPTLYQCYFNTVDMKMYHYNSSAWEQKLRVFVAKAVTTADTATLTIYPFTSRTTASNFIQYDGNGNLQAVDLAGALTQLSASKFIGTFKGDIVGNADTATKAFAADTATKALAADKCTGNADTATKATNDKNGADIAATYLPKSGGTMSGNINWTGEKRVYNSNSNIGFWASDNGTGIQDWGNSITAMSYAPNTNKISFGNASTVTTFAGPVHAALDSTSTLGGTSDKAVKDSDGNPINSTYLKRTGGTINGDISWTGDKRLYNSNSNIGFWANDNGAGIQDWGNSITAMSYAPNTNKISFGNASTVTTFAGPVHAALDSTSTLNGYTAAQLISKVAGRNKPSLTSILDGCYDGNGTKYTKTSNNSAGISGYNTGDIHLTQSYKNFDKILVVLSDDATDYETYTLWDTWKLTYAFSRGWRFGLENGASGGGSWNVFTAVQAGTQTHKLSTDMIWYLSDESSVLVDIIGVNY